MELIDRDVLFNSFNDCSCECGVCQYSLDGLPCGLIENAPTVEAIPKADYENRLKADMVDMLEDLRLDFQEAELAGVLDNKELIFADEVDDLVQQKINALKENSHDD